MLQWLLLLANVCFAFNLLKVDVGIASVCMVCAFFIGLGIYFKEDVKDETP